MSFTLCVELVQFMQIKFFYFRYIFLLLSIYSQEMQFIIFNLD